MNRLDFQFQTVPSPLAISQTGKVYIKIEKQNPDDEISCREIELAIPWGAEDEALVQSAEDICVSVDTPEEWDAGKEQIQRIRKANVNYLLIHFSPKTESARALEKMASFWITGRVSDRRGSAQLLLQAQFDEGEAETYNYTIEKRTQEFYIRNFVSRSSAQSTLPCTAFRKNVPVYFSWESNGTFFSLYAQGNPQPVIETDECSCCLESGVSDSTTFILRAAIEGMQPMYLYEALTIQILDPVMDGLEVLSQFCGSTAKMKWLGTPFTLQLPQADKRTMWVMVAETDGYLIGGLEICHPAVGFGTMCIRVCAAEENHCYETSADACSWDLVIAEDLNVPVRRKASLCVPVPANVPVSLSYSLSYISIAGKYWFQFKFLPIGKGEVQVK